MHYIRLIYLFLPMVLAGVCNMIFMKLSLFQSLKIPMDHGMKLKDNRRIFGDNKTWKGFLGMIFFSSLWLGLFGILFRSSEFFRNMSMIDFQHINAWFWGAAWGSGYVLAELPNSFIKRRLDVEPGKNVSGIRGFVHTFVDQSDSVAGCLLVLLFFHDAPGNDFIFLFFLGTGVHYVTNLLLFFAGLKKQAG